MNWPIFVPSNPAPAGTSAAAKPIHKQLNALGRGTIYQVPSTSSLAALLAALAAAGEAAPSAAAPVWAHLEGQGLYVHRGSGWLLVQPAVGAVAASVRRGANDTLPVGSMASVATVSLGASSPAGRYLIHWMPVVAAAAGGYVNVRGVVGAGTVTNDDRMYVAPPGGQHTLVSTITHSGGATALTLWLQASVASMQVREETRILAAYQGPA